MAIEMTTSQYVLRFGVNPSQAPNQGQKFQPVDQASLVSSEAPFCLAYDPDEKSLVKTNENVRMVLQYMKKPVKLVNLSEEPLNTSGCQAVVASVSSLGKLGDVDGVGDYVGRGGHVFLTHVPLVDDAYYRLYRKLGIFNTGGRIDAQGIRLTSNLLIGEKGLLLDEEFINNPMNAVELEPASRVLAETADGYPLLWDHPYGEGKFMVFNGVMLQEKMSRGVIAGAIGALIPDFIYPVFNSKVMFIDDFPAPFPRGTDEMIYELYKRDIPTFFRDIWWSQILKASKKYDLRMTAVLIQSYNDRVNPPFADPVDEDKQALISYGREVLKSGGEIGLHGYNHQSLQLSHETAKAFGYKAWGSVENMAAAVREAVNYFRDAYPHYSMAVYVPPSNVLSPEGREALKRGWPELSIISSLYQEDESGHSYVQEYEIAEDGILEMPRVTSGYLDRPFERWADANALTSLGLFSHFIHPDDLLDPERSGYLNWDKLYRQFTERLDRVESKYPWLRPMTASEAAADMANVLTSRVDWHKENGVVRGTIDPFTEPVYFILRTDKRIGALQDCKVRKIDEGIFLVQAGKSEFAIELGE